MRKTTGMCPFCDWKIVDKSDRDAFYEHFMIKHKNIINEMKELDFSFSFCRDIVDFLGKDWFDEYFIANDFLQDGTHDDKVRKMYENVEKEKKIKVFTKLITQANFHIEYVKKRYNKDVNELDCFVSLVRKFSDFKYISFFRYIMKEKGVIYRKKMKNADFNESTVFFSICDWKVIFDSFEYVDNEILKDFPKILEWREKVEEFVFKKKEFEL